MWLARDPLALTDEQLLLSPALAQMLVYCDGQHTVDEVKALFERQVGLPIELETINDTLARVDEALLLIVRNTKSTSKSGNVTDLTRVKLGETVDMMQMAAIVAANIEG